jgi:hypothetical protein
VAVAPNSSTDTVLITGGTGVQGRYVVGAPRQRGHDVRVLSRRAGAGTHQGDLPTGQGLDEALGGAGLVVHAASDTPGARATWPRPAACWTRPSVWACATSSTPRSWASIRSRLATTPASWPASRRSLPAGFRTRSCAPRNSTSCWSADSAASRLPVVPLPLDWRFQPVAAAVVAQRMAGLPEEPPLGRAPDFGGPQVLTLGDLVQAWRARRAGPRAVVNLPLPGRTARAFREGVNTAPDHAEGRQTWEQFLGDPGPSAQLRADRPSRRRAARPGSGPEPG